MEDLKEHVLKDHEKCMYSLPMPTLYKKFWNSYEVEIKTFKMFMKGWNVTSAAKKCVILSFLNDVRQKCVG